MNNYISAGLAIAKVVGVTVLVALAVAALIFVCHLIRTLIYASIMHFRKLKAKDKQEAALNEAVEKLRAAGAFIDILGKKMGDVNGTNEQK